MIAVRPVNWSNNVFAITIRNLDEERFNNFINKGWDFIQNFVVNTFFDIDAHPSTLYIPTTTFDFKFIIIKGIEGGVYNSPCFLQANEIRFTIATANYNYLCLKTYYW